MAKYAKQAKGIDARVCRVIIMRMIIIDQLPKSLVKSIYLNFHKI